MTLFYIRENQNHFRSTIGRVDAGSAMWAAGSGPGLFFGVGGEDAENYWYGEFEGDLAQAGGAVVGDDIEMGGFAADDGA